MAFACSDIMLYNYAHLTGDCSIGISTSCWRSRNMVTEVRIAGLQRTSPIESSLYLKRIIFSSSYRLEGGNFCSKKRKGNVGIKSEFRIEVKVDSSDTRTIAVPQEGGDLSLNKEMGNLEPSYGQDLDVDGVTDDSSGSGVSGNFPSGGGGAGGGGSDHGDNEEDNEEDSALGPVLGFEEVIREVEKWGATLPSDMLEAAKTVGIQKVLLLRYLELQASAGPLGYAMKYCSLLRNRVLADPSFLFKVGTEVIIDTVCATFAEVQKRGKDFWAEFELYTADLLVGLAVNIALVGMLAPYARFGQLSSSKGLLGWIRNTCGALPSSVFEAERRGCRYLIQQRIGTYFYKGLLYGSVGFACGIIGQGMANLIMSVKRSVKKSHEDIPVPPLLKSAALWGVFLAVSSNTRYQIINGLERLVEVSPLARRTPTVAMAFTVGVRFANNTFGAMQFVDCARWSGVQ